MELIREALNDALHQVLLRYFILAAHHLLHHTALHDFLQPCTHSLKEESMIGPGSDANANLVKQKPAVPSSRAVSYTLEHNDKHVQRQYKVCNSRHKSLGFQLVPPIKRQQMIQKLHLPCTS